MLRPFRRYMAAKHTFTCACACEGNLCVHSNHKQKPTITITIIHIHTKTNSFCHANKQKKVQFQAATTFWRWMLVVLPICCCYCCYCGVLMRKSTFSINYTLCFCCPSFIFLWCLQHSLPYFTLCSLLFLFFHRYVCVCVKQTTRFYPYAHWKWWMTFALLCFCFLLYTIEHRTSHVFTLYQSVFDRGTAEHPPHIQSKKRCIMRTTLNMNQMYKLRV